MIQTIPSVETLTGGTANRFLLAGGAGIPAVQETAAQVKTRLDLSGTNTGDQDLSAYATTVAVAAAYQPIGSYAAASHTHTASAITDFAEAVDDEVATLLVAGTNITLTYNDAGNSLTIASTGAGVGGSTGATDNRLLRSDGTGGATVQNSAITVDDSGNMSGVTTISIAGSGSASAPLLLFSGAGGGNQIGLYRASFDLVAVTQGTPVLRMSYTAGTTITRDNFFGITSGQFDATAACDTRWSRSSAGVWRAGTTANNALATVELATLTASALIGLGTYTVATLPSAAANPRRIAAVTDSSVTTNGSAVAGGGSSSVMVFSNGSTWDVVVA